VITKRGNSGNHGTCACLASRCAGAPQNTPIRAVPKPRPRSLLKKAAQTGRQDQQDVTLARAARAQPSSAGPVRRSSPLHAVSLTSLSVRDRVVGVLFAFVLLGSRYIRPNHPTLRKSGGSYAR
jgi:hypothetical protein